MLDCMLPVAHRRRPECLNPGAELLDGDLTDPATVRRALRGVDAVCHQAAMVGLGQNMLDIADYVRHNDLGTAVLLRELAAAGFAGRLVLASSMVVYGEGAYRCPAPRPDRRTAAQPGATEPRPVRAMLSALRARARAGRGRRVLPPRSPERVRRDQGAPGASLLRVLARHRGSGHRAALPQRLRTADAARHAVRRGRGVVRQRARQRAGASRVRGRAAAARLRSRPRRRTRQRARANERVAAAAECSTSPADTPAASARWPWRSRARRERVPLRRSSPASFGLAMCVMCSPRRIGPNGCWASGQANTSTPGCRSSRPPRCESPEGPLARGRRERAGPQLPRLGRGTARRAGIAARPPAPAGARSRWPASARSSRC